MGRDRINDSMINEIPFRNINDSMINDKAHELWKSCGKVATQRADRIADRLAAKLKAPECRSFFCKCAYALSENEIEILLELSLRDGIKAPKRYFTRSARMRIEEQQSRL